MRAKHPALSVQHLLRHAFACAIAPAALCASLSISSAFAQSLGPDGKQKPAESGAPTQPAKPSATHTSPAGTTTTAKPAGATIPQPAPGTPSRPAPSTQPKTGNPRATPIAPPGAVPAQPGKGQPAGPAGTGVQPGAQGTPGAQPGGAPTPEGGESALSPASIATSDPEMVTLSAFSEPVQLSALVNLVAATLGINVTIIDSLDGTVAFNAAVPVKKSELLNLLDALLEQHGWTITKDESIGWYTVRNANSVGVNFKGEIITTRVFPTPNLRPSAVQQAISGQLGGGTGGVVVQPGVVGGGGGGASGGKLQPIDELGIIVATDTPRRLAIIEDLIRKIQEEYAKAQFIRLDLVNIAAPNARDRVLQLIGQAPQGRGGIGVDANQQAQFNPAVRAAGMTGGGGALDNIGDRLTVDPQGNALIFRGLQAEIDQVQNILKVIDVPHSLIPKRYYAGSSATQIADVARNRGMGEVTTIATGMGMNDGAMPGAQFNANQFNRAGGFNTPSSSTSGTSTGGPVMVVDEANGTIIYYGTEAQQTQLEKLIAELDTQSERIEVREYKLKNSDAEDVADVILGLLNNQSLVGSSDFLPDNSSGFGNFGSGNGFGSFGGNNSGSNGRFRNQTSRNRLRQPNNMMQNGLNNPQANSRPGLGGEGLELDASNAFVIADIKNNQILVKAPAGVQPQFAKLIEKLDLRRPQVYLECKIVAVSWSDDLRLAFETQLLNANGLGGVLQTNFGLTTAGQTITDRRNVVTGLSGLTAAILKKDYVPIVMTALQTKADTQILSSPALLVDDNEEAQIVSVEEQPYSTTQTSSGTPNVTSLGGYVEAGTKLTIKPHISEDGYLRLKYETELSNFTGAAQPNLPPPKQTNQVNSDNITVPSDTAVIVGGINIDTNRKTRIQVPLLGDIPILGQLFQDYNRTNRKTTLYVFITPRILHEPTFADLRLLTEGPQKKSLQPPDVPALTPTAIDITIDALHPASPADTTAPHHVEEPAGGAPNHN